MVGRSCKQCFHYKACKEVSSHKGYVDIYYLESQCKHFTPTEDVVPRAEVEKLRARAFEQGKRDNVYGLTAEELAQKSEQLAVELEAMRSAANSYKMHYENLAREIFEEIEKVVNYALCVDITDWSSFVELKKKYTEGNRNG